MFRKIWLIEKLFKLLCYKEDESNNRYCIFVFANSWMRSRNLVLRYSLSTQFFKDGVLSDGTDEAIYISEGK